MNRANRFTRFNNIDALVKAGGEVTIGRVGPVRCGATAADEDQWLTMLARRPEESLDELPDTKVLVSTYAALEFRNSIDVLFQPIYSIVMRRKTAVHHVNDRRVSSESIHLLPYKFTINQRRLLWLAGSN